ncbi:hypothetical protein BC830DRAFT_1119307 [Chytriomyces sp. MP71]|nr:hypothetical protein BC830DRAFT_1119307 [Chytriomyces sp. MP71]
MFGVGIRAATPTVKAGASPRGQAAPTALLLHTSAVALSRNPALYQRVTRRQDARVAAKEAQLLAKQAANPGLAVHVDRMRQRAHRLKVHSLVASSAIDVPALSPSSPASSALATASPLAPFLASKTHRSPLSPAKISVASFSDLLTRARAFSDENAASATAATNSTTTSSSNMDASANDIRSFKRTTIAGAAPLAAVAASTADGIPTIAAAAIAAAATGSAPADARIPSFAYGVTAAEAKTVLLDAPKHLEDLAAKVGKGGAYDAGALNSSATNSNGSVPPLEVAELVRRQLSLDNASSKEIHKFNRQRVIDMFGRTGHDTGSSEVQAAVLTVKVDAMRAHVEKMPKDKSSKRRLQAILSKRAGLLKYLRRKDLPKFVITCRALGVDPETITA